MYRLQSRLTQTYQKGIEKIRGMKDPTDYRRRRVVIKIETFTECHSRGQEYKSKSISLVLSLFLAGMSVAFGMNAVTAQSITGNESETNMTTEQLLQTAQQST